MFSDNVILGKEEKVNLLNQQGMHRISIESL